MAIQFSPQIARGNRGVNSSPQSNVTNTTINGNNNTNTTTNNNSVDQSVTTVNNSSSFRGGDTMSANIPQAPQFAQGPSAAGGCSSCGGGQNAGQAGGANSPFELLKNLLQAMVQNQAGQNTPGNGASNQMGSFAGGGGCGCSQA